MSAQPIKKKRFEGLIQFQDPLRQALVCLQSALAERFVTGAQLDFLQMRDTSEASHFLLSSDGSAVGELKAGLEARHLLMRIEQLDHCLPKSPSPDLESKISAWLDTSDPLTAQYLFHLLAHASAPAGRFDLSQLCSWGAMTVKDLHPDSALSKQDWLNAERIALMQSFQAEAAGLFTKIDKLSLTTDGCSVSLLLEGPTSLSWQDLRVEALGKLAKQNRHLVSLNYNSGPKPTLQCAYLTPMRLPLKDLQTSTLKGFFLLCDIKVPAKS